MSSDTGRKQNTNRCDKLCTVTNARKTFAQHCTLVKHYIYILKWYLHDSIFSNQNFKHFSRTVKDHKITFEEN